MARFTPSPEFASQSKLPLGDRIALARKGMSRSLRCIRLPSSQAAAFCVAWSCTKVAQTIQHCQVFVQATHCNTKTGLQIPIQSRKQSQNVADY